MIVIRKNLVTLNSTLNLARLTYIDNAIKENEVTNEDGTYTCTQVLLALEEKRPSVASKLPQILWIITSTTGLAKGIPRGYNSNVGLVEKVTLIEDISEYQGINGQLFQYR